MPKGTADAAHHHQEDQHSNHSLRCGAAEICHRLFVTTLQAMAKDDAFNKRSINITQDKDKPVLKVESKAGASNGQYDISVEQLAKTSKFDGTFDSSTTPLITQDGKLTFKAGDKTFDVDVKAGDSLQSIRKRINNDADNFGLSVNIMNTSDGKSKLMIDSGVSGSGKDLQITGSTTELTDNLVSKLTKSQSAQDARIKVDGNTLTSATNTFDGTIVGLKLTVLKESDSTTSTDADGNPVKTYSSNKVDVSTDKAGIKDMVKSFVDGYNALVKKSNELGKRNSIVAGKSQNDGGALAGDATTRAVINMMNGAITEPSQKSSTYSTIFQMGVKMDNKGFSPLMTPSSARPSTKTLIRWWPFLVARMGWQVNWPDNWKPTPKPEACWPSGKIR